MSGDAGVRKTSSSSSRPQRGFGFTHESTYNESIEWYTPPEIFGALGLTFDLDPCSPLAGPLSWIPARRFFTIADDGLSQSWKGRVWMNPPYGKHTPAWMHKLAEHGNGIALVFARTDTSWFHTSAETADALCFIRRRLRFIAADGIQVVREPGSGSVLLAFGDECADALRRSDLGLVLASEKNEEDAPE